MMSGASRPSGPISQIAPAGAAETRTRAAHDRRAETTSRRGSVRTLASPEHGGSGQLVGLASQSVGALHRLLHAAAPPELLVLESPFDWWISATEWYEPDLIVFSRSAPGELRLEVPPLLVVEVASPSTRLIDLNAKKAAYAENRCPSYWIVDPGEPAITAFELRAGEYERWRRCAGEERFEASAPFAVSFRPADLLASGTGGDSVGSG